ncbi:MAG: hypothetical protein WA173_01040 [Pseudomonas sp.]
MLGAPGFNSCFFSSFISASAPAAQLKNHWFNLSVVVIAALASNENVGTA